MNRRNFLTGLAGLPLAAVAVGAAGLSDLEGDGVTVVASACNVEGFQPGSVVRLETMRLLGWDQEQWAIAAARFPGWYPPVLNGAYGVQHQWRLTSYGVEPGDPQFYGSDPKDYNWAMTMLGNVMYEQQRLFSPT